MARRVQLATQAAAARPSAVPGRIIQDNWRARAANLATDD